MWLIDFSASFVVMKNWKITKKPRNTFLYFCYMILSIKSWLSICFHFSQVHKNGAQAFFVLWVTHFLETLLSKQNNFFQIFYCSTWHVLCLPKNNIYYSYIQNMIACCIVYRYLKYLTNSIKVNKICTSFLILFHK